MLSLSQLLWLILAGIVVHYWWQSGQFKGRARDFAIEHCKQLNLQLLDHSMVIIGLWPSRNPNGRLGFRRTYQFEFTSTADDRYQGILILEGMSLKTIHLETYKLPDVE